MSNTIKPSFFIVGAPKCGTSALFQYLKTHPNIYVPFVKELDYFSFDLSPKTPLIASEEDYLAMFRDCSDEQIAGEASVLYMYSEVAIPKIRELNKDARLIAIVRNPLDMLHSYHQVNINNWDEDCSDFETAWRLESRRAQGESIPKTCNNPKRLMYSQIGRQGFQVKRMLENFPHDQVKVIVFEDFVRHTADAYAEVLAFLGLPNDGRTTFPNVNAAQARKYPKLTQPLYRPPRVLKPLVEHLKKLAGPYKRVIAKTINRVTMKPSNRKPLSSEFGNELLEHFREDIQCLSDCLGKDLSGWLEERPPRR